MRRDKPETQQYMLHLDALNSTKNRPVAGWNSWLLARWIEKKDFPNGTFDLKGPKLNVLIRDKISFDSVAHLMRGDRSCLCALYRSHPCTIVGS